VTVFTIWVCQCCMLVAANGECCDEHVDGQGVLSRIAEGYRVTLGSSSEEHRDTCTSVDRREGCDCDYIDLSQSWCEGCGSTLHGERHALTVWVES
jgi:hypothetical protein